MINFAQWRYTNQWSIREVVLLLVENYSQYPGRRMWNTILRTNFWPLPTEATYICNILQIIRRLTNMIKRCSNCNFSLGTFSWATACLHILTIFISKTYREVFCCLYKGIRQFKLARISLFKLRVFIIVPTNIWRDE